ncbi:MAG TPA: 2-amino-4-hydroxy-6-hydroxymethyldihydropteridine diphosphokinase [Burkholderiales bacterium]
MTIAFVGLGSNQEDPRRQVALALRELAELPQTRLIAASSLYRSSPLGYASQPDFINAAAKLDTALEAVRLLEALQAIEAAHGRRRSFPNAPRTLDLDLLLYADRKLDSAGLTLPHPRMHERAFVLKPLLELEPELSIPGRGEARALLAAVADQAVERIA